MFRKFFPLHPMLYLALSPNGQWLAVTSEDAIYFWEVDSYTFLKQIPGHFGKVKWHPDGSHFMVYAASSSSQNQLEFWDIGDDHPYATLYFNGSTSSATWHPDGTKIAHSVNYTDFVVIDAHTFSPITE